MNVRQLKFAQGILLGLRGTEAAVGAGYSPKSAHVQASNLLRHPKVMEYLSENRREIAREAVISVAEVLRDLARYADLAEVSGQYPAAVRAKELIGKQIGMFTDKVEVEHRSYVVAPDQLGQDEWETKYGTTH